MFFDTTADPMGNLRLRLGQLRAVGGGSVKSLICSDTHDVWLEIPKN